MAENLMSRHFNNTASDARGLRTAKVAVKGCDTAPARLTRREAHEHLALTQQNIMLALNQISRLRRTESNLIKPERREQKMRLRL